MQQVLNVCSWKWARVQEMCDASFDRELTKPCGLVPAMGSIPVFDVHLEATVVLVSIRGVACDMCTIPHIIAHTPPGSSWIPSWSILGSDQRKLFVENLPTGGLQGVTGGNGEMRVCSEKTLRLNS